MPGRASRKKAVSFLGLGRRILQKYGELAEVLGGEKGKRDLQDTLVAYWLAQDLEQRQELTNIKRPEQVGVVVAK